MTEVACLKCGIKGTNAKDRSQPATAQKWQTCIGCLEVYCSGKEESCWDSWNESHVLDESNHEDLADQLCFTCCLATRAAEQAMHDFGAAVDVLMAMHAAGEPEANKEFAWHKLHFSVSAIKAVSTRLCRLLGTAPSDFTLRITAPEDFDLDFRRGAFKHAITSPFDPKVLDPEALERRLEEIKRQMLDSIAFPTGTCVEGSGGGGEGTAGTGKRRCLE